MSGSNLNEPYLFLNQSSIQDDNFNSKIMIVQMDSTIEDDEVLTDSDKNGHNCSQTSESQQFSDANEFNLFDDDNTNSFEQSNKIINKDNTQLVTFDSNNNNNNVQVAKTVSQESSSLIASSFKQKSLNNQANLESLTAEKYVGTRIPKLASFQLSQEDWSKLQSLQRGHRFMRGEWEDYFVLGMKESNKYCVFAFKDHYVNQSYVRKRKTNMNQKPRGKICADSSSQTELKGKKMFSATGYCVFEDCPIKFLIKMNCERVVHVFYEGEIKHSVNDVHARYFRGKSRHELKEVLKYSTPMKEYLKRVKSSVYNEHLEAGNVDYVGKSTSVYRRIASEAKDCYQALLQLRNQLIQKSLVKVREMFANNGKTFDENKVNKNYTLGYIQMIQHIPGCIICYEYNQLKIYHSLFIKSKDLAVLNISCYKEAPLVNTTINGSNIFYYEMSIRSPIDLQLIPLSCMLTTDPMSSFVIDQWLRLFLGSEKNAFHQYYMNQPLNENSTKSSKYIMCDNSMVLIEKVLEFFNNENFETYSNRCFYNCFNSQKFLDDTNHLGIDFGDVNDRIFEGFDNIGTSQSIKTNKVLVHICINQLMNEINKLCKYYYSSGNNFNFGMYAFSVIVNSESLLELQQSIYSFMCILYSGSINPLVKKVFEHLKLRVNYFEALNRMYKSSKNSYYLYNSNFHANNKSYQKQTSTNIQKISSKSAEICFTDLIANNYGLIAINKRCKQRKSDVDLIEFKLNNLNNKSVFHKMCEMIFQKCKYDIEKCEADLEPNELARNPRQGHQLLYYFIHQFSASLPLWTNINMPLISNDFKLPMTLSAQDERFGILHSQFSIVDDEKENDSLDVFIKRLSEDNSFLIEKILQLCESFTDSNSNQEKRKQMAGLDNSKSVIFELITSEDEASEYLDSDENEDDLITTVDSEKLFKVLKKHKNDLIRVKSQQTLLATPNDNGTSRRGRKRTTLDMRCENEEPVEETEREVVIERENLNSSSEFNFELSKEDLESLESNPNTKVIEFYMKMLELKANSNQVDFKVLVYPVNFYLNLKHEYENQSACQMQGPITNQRLTNRERIFDYSLVLIPIQKCDNWSLAAIDFRKQKITYYDPLLFNDFDCLKHLTNYIEKEYYHQEKVKYDFRNWKINNEKNIPKNINHQDCGIFILLYVKRLLSNQSEISFKTTADEVLNFRSQLKNEIFQSLFAM